MKLFASLLLLPLMHPLNLTAQSAPQKNLESSVSSVTHISQPSRHDFKATIELFEAQLGTIKPEDLQIPESLTPDQLEELHAKLNSLAGKSGFMRFDPVRNLGFLLPLVGQPRAKAIQYCIGNPVLAAEMAQHDLGAALYPPLRILIFEDREGVTRIDFDLPSSIFGRFGNEKISAVAADLDAKLLHLVKAVAE